MSAPLLTIDISELAVICLFSALVVDLNVQGFEDCFTMQRGDYHFRDAISESLQRRTLRAATRGA